MARYQLGDDELASLTQSIFILDSSSDTSSTGGSKMAITHIDVTDYKEPVKSQPVMEEVLESKEIPLKQTTAGGYIGKKGVNIERSGDEVKSHVDTLYFWDGVRKIDMVLAYEDPQPDKDEEENIKRRKIFMRNLEAQGLDLELETSRNSADGKTNFLKISAQDKILEKYAKILGLEKPTKKYDVISYGQNMELIKGSLEYIEGFFGAFEYDHTLIPPEPSFFSAGVSFDVVDKFIIKVPSVKFSSAQRSMIVWEILARTSYDDKQKDKKGIMRLLSSDVFKAAYPLHDGRYDNEGDKDVDQDDCTRMLLHDQWARAGCWYKKQPFSLVKRYFGDKIGLYFCWLGFYTQMLIVPAIMGLFVFLYGAITLKSDENFPTEEICDEYQMGNTTMCPQCDQNCPFWRLQQSCLLSKITYMFDNSATVFFTVFMSFWATLYLELWKRRQAVIAWEWDLRDFDEPEHTRPEFEAKVKTTRINPVTKQPEPFIPPFNKGLRIVFTNSFVLLMLLMVVMVMFAIMLYRVAVIVSMYSATKGTVFSPYAGLITSLTASVINLVVILVLNEIYQHIALWLTNLECPRTQTEFEDSFTLKKFMFQFINYYSSIFYIAFFKGKFFTHPGETVDTNLFARFKSDVCDPAGCIYDLFIQLAIVMVGKQAMNNFIELLYPKIVVWWKKHVYRSSVVHPDGSSAKDRNQVYTRWEQDYNLQDVDRLECLDEYLEMVIQYGFITLFVSAFPLAPFFALLNNIFEIRLDAYKYIATKRRPLSERAQDIGAWFGILHGITYLSIVTNAITIALSSDFIPHWVYKLAYSSDGSLSGFVNFSLTKFNVSEWGPPNGTNWAGPHDLLSTPGDIPEFCYFKGHRDEQYRLNLNFYLILGSKLVFVLVYEHFIFFMTGLLKIFIPDVPANVQLQTQREYQLVRETLYEYEAEEGEEKTEEEIPVHPEENLNLNAVGKNYFNANSAL